MKPLPILMFALVACGAWNYLARRAVPQAAGILAPQAPVQSDRLDTRVFTTGSFQITPLASFTVQARVLGVAEYRVGREADLSPVDLALGWGRMSDTTVIDQLDIRQNNRFYFYSWSGQPPLPPHEIVEHSANMHLIPANEGLEKQLRKVRVGNVVELSGYLVRADAADGWHWVSSLTRSDSGAGACELVWVERLTVR